MKRHHDSGCNLLVKYSKTLLALVTTKIGELDMEVGYPVVLSAVAALRVPAGTRTLFNICSLILELDPARPTHFDQFT